jgi:hypothetical protein
MQILTAAMMARSAEVKVPSRMYGTILLGHCAAAEAIFTMPRVAFSKYGSCILFECYALLIYKFKGGIDKFLVSYF